MRLHNLHIRVTAEERDYIAILAEHMNCSMSKLIRMLLFDTDMKKIVKDYQVQKEAQRFGSFFHCDLDKNTIAYLENYATELNQNTQQIRRIGTNVSALIRDIRAGLMTGTPPEKQMLDERLSYIMFAVNREMEKQGKLADTLLDILDGVDINVKMI